MAGRGAAAPSGPVGYPDRLVDDQPPAAPDEPAEPLAPQAPVRSQAPAVPWGFDIRLFGADYTPLPDGGMLMQMTIGMRHPQMGAVPMAPSFQFRFTAASWQQFQREVAAGGVKSQVQTATVLPPGVRPQG